MPDLKANIEMLGNPNSPDYLLKPMTQLAGFLKAQGKIPSVPDLAKFLDPQLC